VTLKNAVFWDVTPCDSCKKRLFGGTHRLLHQGEKNRVLFLHSVLQLLVTANVLNLLILFTLMTEAIRSSETSVLTRATQRNIQDCS
jgi:hypothetical protein